MKIGVFATFMSPLATARMIRDFGRRAEGMGLESIWMGEHVALFDKNTYGYPGSKDGRIGAAMPAVDSAMKALGKNYVGKNYEGAVHGFLRAQDDPKPTRDEAEEQANLAATKDGWPRTVEFLKKNLGVK